MLRKLTVFIFLVICLGLYALTVRGIWGNPRAESIKDNLDQATKPLELSPERGRYALVMSLAQDQSFSISKVLADAVHPDVAVYQGRYYILFAPGISLMALPLYYLGDDFNLGQVAAFYLSGIFATLNFLIIYLLGNRIFKLPFWACLFASLIYSFASSSWAYAITLYQHQVTTFLLYSSFYAAWCFKRKDRLSFLYASYVWLAVAVAIAVDYPNAVFFIPILVYFLWTAFSWELVAEKLNISFRPVVIFTSLVFLAVGFLHAYSNLVHYGDWKKISSTLPSYEIPEKKKDAQGASIDPSQTAADVPKKNAVRFFSEQKFPNGLRVLFVSDERGLFYFFPIFILLFPGIWLFVRQSSAEKIALVAIGAVVVFLYSSWGDPWGGWAFGPRYLTPMIPVASLLIAAWVSQTKYIFVRKMVALFLFLPSLAVALLGALTTNAIPPQSEAVLLNIGFNYWYNLQFFLNEMSGSFVFNNFASSYFSLMNYYTLIYLTVVALSLLTLFIFPRVHNYDH